MALAVHPPDPTIPSQELGGSAVAFRCSRCFTVSVPTVIVTRENVKVVSQKNVIVSMG
jgi:hypothetical protein